MDSAICTTPLLCIPSKGKDPLLTANMSVMHCLPERVIKNQFFRHEQQTKHFESSMLPSILKPYLQNY